MTTTKETMTQEQLGTVRASVASAFSQHIDANTLPEMRSLKSVFLRHSLDKTNHIIDAAKALSQAFFDKETAAADSPRQDENLTRYMQAVKRVEQAAGNVDSMNVIDATEAATTALTQQAYAQLNKFKQSAINTVKGETMAYDHVTNLRFSSSGKIAR